MNGEQKQPSQRIHSNKRPRLYGRFSPVKTSTKRSSTKRTHTTLNIHGIHTPDRPLKVARRGLSPTFENLSQITQLLQMCELERRIRRIKQ